MENKKKKLIYLIYVCKYIKLNRNEMKWNRTKYTCMHTYRSVLILKKYVDDDDDDDDDEGIIMMESE